MSRAAPDDDTLRDCPGCGSDAPRVIGTKAGHELARCRACATLFVERLPRPEAGHDYDGYYYERNLTVPAIVERRLDEIVAGLSRHRQTNRWIDIGCGAGSLLHAAERAGWQAEGTEISPGAVAALAQRGATIHLGDVMTLPIAPGAYDVVSLVEVLEHVPAPREMLRRARELLRPGGIIYLTTPHGRGLSARLLGLRWSVACPPEHLQLFSLGGLRHALADAGFDRPAIRARGINPHELAHAFRSRRQGGPRSMPGTERVRTSYELNAALEGSRSGVRVKRAGNVALGTLRLGDGLTAQAVRPRLEPSTGGRAVHAAGRR